METQNEQKAKEYVGHAEDLYDYLYGRQEQQAYDDWVREQEEAYYEEMYAKYEQEMQEMFEGGKL